MNLIHFEIGKIVNKRISLVLIVVTGILFPTLIKIISYLSAVKDNVPEGLFADHVAYGIITFSQSYFFLPIWIIVFVGLELSNGHVNRVVFATSRTFYFLSKIVYCGIITFGFSVIGLISILIALKTSPFQQLTVDPIFYFHFLLQLTVSTFGYSIVLLSMVFIFRSPAITFIIYLGWTLVEGLIFTIFKGIYHIEMKWLPFYLIRTFYSRNGETLLVNYYMPSPENWTSLLFPIGFVLLLIVIIFRHFSKSDLKPLSD